MNGQKSSNFHFFHLFAPIEVSVPDLGELKLVDGEMYRGYTYTGGFRNLDPPMRAPVGVLRRKAKKRPKMAQKGQ